MSKGTKSQDTVSMFGRGVYAHASNSWFTVTRVSSGAQKPENRTVRSGIAVCRNWVRANDDTRYSGWEVLRAWLDAFNSGDRAKVEAYIKTFEPQQSVERMMGFHDQTGGFDLLAIDGSEPLLVKFL